MADGARGRESALLVRRPVDAQRVKSTNPKVLRGNRKFDPAHQVSSFAVDSKALHFAVNDTVVETRGDFKVYRPGDIWRMLQGTVFQR